ncbi:DNA polymerase lambda [Chionoecetes opilio]|uniref:DNA polymerase n=1 Tax=Chionoecetes opilio TaxID=41210 RepID=A0A8J5CFR0_CHIOP|nr:DNA polymerase lambda [Chionoecetes opilio]
MKRRNKGSLPCAKRSKGECEAGEPPPPFLDGVKCHVHPASFGLMRRRIFENHVTRYGGELVASLPLASDVAYHVVFEETVDQERLKRLLDPSALPKSLFLRCTWLVACVKAMAKAGTEDHLIVPMNSVEEQSPEETGATQPKGTNGTCLGVNTQAEETNRVPMEEPDRMHQKEIDTTSPESQRTINYSTINEKPKVKDTFPSGDPLTRVASHPSPHEQMESLESQASTVVRRENTKLEDKKEPSNLMAGEEQGNTSVARREGGGSEEDSLASLIRPFPKNLQEKFACARPSSSKRVDLNAHITSELQKLATTYKSKNDTWRAVGYERAISAIKNYGKKITSREEALALPGIGGRLADKVAEILESGRLRKVAEVCEGEEAECLRLFLGVWGAGPNTAQAWYLQGFRTLEDLRTKATLTRHQQVGLKHYQDINDRIPRCEVVEIEDHVREAAVSLVRGVEVTVCGSYRRGKATCGDVDVLITHPDGNSHQAIFKPLLARLRDTGFLTDDLVTQEDNGNQQKYLGVCRLPGRDRKHRRLDVIVVPYSERATAIMYFTGSAHFNRSMRLLATKKGMSLSEHSLRVGIVRQGGEKLNDGCMLETPTEESVFTHLGLEYRPPQERDH